MAAEQQPSSWVIVENPAYEGQTPRPLGVACHDGSPFLTIRCTCGGEMHLHETQLAVVPADAEIVTRCHGCSGPLVFPPGKLAGAFEEMREAGWIA